MYITINIWGVFFIQSAYGGIYILWLLELFQLGINMPCLYLLADFCCCCFLFLTKFSWFFTSAWFQWCQWSCVCVCSAAWMWTSCISCTSGDISIRESTSLNELFMFIQFLPENMCLSYTVGIQVGNLLLWHKKMFGAAVFFSLGSAYSFGVCFGWAACLGFGKVEQ